MSARQEKTREALAFEAFTVMDEEQWIVDAALAEVEEWETRLAEITSAYEASVVDQTRLEAAEAEADRLKAALEQILKVSFDPLALNAAYAALEAADQDTT